jgi:hypothetical protein
MKNLCPSNIEKDEEIHEAQQAALTLLAASEERANIENARRRVTASTAESQTAEPKSGCHGGQ